MFIPRQPKHPVPPCEVRYLDPQNILTTPSPGGGPGCLGFLGVSKKRVPPKSSILIGFSIINHPFLGYPYFWKQPYGYMVSIGNTCFPKGSCHSCCICVLRETSLSPPRSN